MLLDIKRDAKEKRYNERNRGKASQQNADCGEEVD